MKFRNQRHQELFHQAIRRLDRQNYTLMAVVYLFAADNRLWSMTEKSICYSGVDFSRIQLRNPNNVVMTWKRTSTDYYDTLVDDAHVYTYGIELTKLFSDGKDDFSKVEFLIHNDTDGYYVKAELNAEEGIYYMVDHVAEEADATYFIPVESGKIIIKGLEDDTYTITEVRTDNGYVLLKEFPSRKLSTMSCVTKCPTIFASRHWWNMIWTMVSPMRPPCRCSPC